MFTLFIIMVILVIFLGADAYTNYNYTSQPRKPMYKGKLRRFKRDGSHDSFYVIDPADGKMILVNENQKTYEDAEDGI